jgi:glycosyltransferase involved in cell wall biosynthesis
MTIVQITPGTGGMYCGNCFRDNALVAGLRQLGHEVLMVPLYLPLTLDEVDQSAGMPIFFSGINVYLAQRFKWFQAAPAWLHRLLASPALLTRAAGRSAKTRPEEVGAILLSMLRGAEGRQARELRELIVWLKEHTQPDVICLSNALLLGLAREFKRELNARVVCFLQGEDSYLDSLGDTWRDPAWQLVSERAQEVDLFIAPNRYFAELMTRRLGLSSSRVQVVPDGIRLEGYEYAQSQEHMAASHPDTSTGNRYLTIGFFARMCREKGLHLLLEAFVGLRRRPGNEHLRLKVGGGCGPVDEPFVRELQARLVREGLTGEVTFHPNLSRAAKLEFLRSLDVFSVPTTYPEAFGLYLLEAMAAGVPVVQPRLAGFPELVQTTGGGVLYEPNTVEALMDSLQSLVRDRTRSQALGRKGQEVVFKQFSADAMARNFVQTLQATR